MGAFDVESSKYTKLKKAYVVEGGKYVKLPKGFVVEGGKYVKIWSAGGKYFCFCASRAVLTSDDAVTWTIIKNDTMTWTGTIQGVYYLNGVFVIAEKTSGSSFSYNAHYSSDCVTWGTATKVGGAYSNSVFRQCNDVLCMVNSRHVYKTTNGSAWTLVGLSALYASYGLGANMGNLIYAKYNNAYYYITSNHDYTGRVGSEIIISTDLLNWTNIYSGNNSQSSGLPKPRLILINGEVYGANAVSSISLFKLNSTSSGLTYIENSYSPSSGVSGSPSLSYDEESDNLIVSGSGMYGTSYKAYTSRSTNNDGYTAFTGSYAVKYGDKRIRIYTNTAQPPVTTISYTTADFYTSLTTNATWVETYSASAVNGNPIPSNLRYFE